MSYDPNKKPIQQSRIAEFVMSDKQIVNLLIKTDVGHIATRDKNQPFIIPTTFWYSKENHEIYFHSNAFGRIKYNVSQNPEVCFECFESGRLLPSNIPLEKSIQYKSVIIFGKVIVIDDKNQKREILNGLLNKYFGEMKSGKDYRPITDTELKQTSVYKIKIDQWSGKNNWPEKLNKQKIMNGQILNPNGLIDTKPLAHHKVFLILHLMLLYQCLMALMSELYFHMYLQ
ncbi:MAG: NimA [Candidatus Marinimicrobia bacterium]|nr:NimA [Candidatus Neomarinimicrobiota bacterium]